MFPDQGSKLNYTTKQKVIALPKTLFLMMFSRDNTNILGGLVWDDRVPGTGRKREPAGR